MSIYWCGVDVPDSNKEEIEPEMKSESEDENDTLDTFGTAEDLDE